MKTTETTIHTAKLTNNCPTCYATDGLELTFTQTIKETLFYNKAATETNDSLHCHTCNQTIYPVDWNEDIERVYDYNKKLAVPNNKGYTLKTLAYWIIFVDVLIMAALVYYFFLN